MQGHQYPTQPVSIIVNLLLSICAGAEGRTGGRSAERGIYKLKSH